MIIDLVLTGFLFLPGALLLSIISEKMKLQLNVLEKVLFGSLLWNFLFLAPSVLIGLSTEVTIQYFRIFSITSSLVVVISVIILIEKQRIKTKKIKIKINQLGTIYGLGFICLLFFSMLAIYFHTLFIEWDAVYSYIPSAKAILLSGGITSQPYRLLNFFDASPSIPLMYSWVMMFSSIESLYALPIAFFVLTLVTIWLISHALFPNTAAISTLIFMSLPTVMITVSSRALYLDMAFLLYLLATLYTTIKMVNTKPEEKFFSFQFVMFTVTFTLMFLTKSDLGLLLAPTAVATLIFASKFSHWKIVSILFIGLPYYVREARNISIDPASWTYYLQRLVPVIMLSAMTFTILTILGYQKTKNKRVVFDKRFILFLLILISPVIIYLARNMLVSGFILPGLPLWNTDIINTSKFFYTIMSSPTTDFSALMQWHNLFSVWWFITPYVIPFWIAVASIIYKIIKERKTNLKNVPLLLFFSGIFILWSQLGCDPQPRRLYYLAPFAALAITYGFYKIRKFYNFQAFALRILTYVMAITVTTWTKNGIKTVNDLALLYGSLYQPKMDFELLGISIGLFLAIFAPYEFLTGRIKQKIIFSKKVTTAIFSSFLLLNVGLFSILATPMIIDVVNNGFQLRYKRYSGWYYYPDVVDYYNENITDHYTTLGFYCNELITFANRTIIDLYIPIYGSPIYSIIEKANSTEILEVFRKLNVGYFLKPKTNNPFYPTYEKLVNSTVLGSIFLDNPQFSALETFKYATLYKFCENYTIHPLTYSEINPWNYDPETNHTLTLDQNLTKFSATTNSAGRISIMYIPEPPLNLGDALWITIKSYSDAELVAILFSNLQNRTTDFHSFQCQLNNETRKPVININGGTIKGNFDPNHVEGLLIGIRTEPNHKETFEISGLYLIAYENT